MDVYDVVFDEQVASDLEEREWCHTLLLSELC